MREVHLLGTRGVPAEHGGFESFVARLGPFLAGRGWKVFIYCQREGDSPIEEDEWQGVTRVLVSVTGVGTLSTIKFDWISLRYALKRDGLLFSFGYPTGVFALWPAVLGRRHLINMDGIEWKRSQFGILGRISYFLNEILAAKFATHLVADHPEIAKHLHTRVTPSKVTTIAYGADEWLSDAPDLNSSGMGRSQYCLVVARPEPDNSIYEIVRCFSSKKRSFKMMVLGKYDLRKKYHKKVLSAASEDVIFPGAVYDATELGSLRANCCFYVHGHRVGGTNPSLVEALGAGSPIIAHNNKFNRWVAGDAALYFSNMDDLSAAFDFLSRDDEERKMMRIRAKRQWRERFQWSMILTEYEYLIAKFSK